MCVCKKLGAKRQRDHEAIPLTLQRLEGTCRLPCTQCSASLWNAAQRSLSLASCPGDLRAAEGRESPDEQVGLLSPPHTHQTLGPQPASKGR